MKISIVGAGNVATHMSQALKGAGHQITSVISRTQASAVQLAALLECEALTIETVMHKPDSLADTELCIISVKDDAIGNVAEHLIPLAPHALWVHTAGSVPISILQDKSATRTGVFYPMQTFSKQKSVDFNKIPIFIESTTDQAILEQLACSITQHVYVLDGEGRKYLHLAAVFACNFVNHCYALSAEVLSQVNIPFEVMLPLIDETADKVHHLSPQQAQTGPAIRHDRQVMNRQQTLLADHPILHEIYQLMSKSIEEQT